MSHLHGVESDVSDAIVVDDDVTVHGHKQGVTIVKDFVERSAFVGVFPNFDGFPSLTVVGRLEHPSAVGEVA